MPKTTEKPTRIIAFVNHKGGVGKTTTVLNVAAGLHIRGRSVLMVDMDAQANLTTSVGLSQEEDSTIYDVLTQKKTLPEIIRKCNNGTFIAPSALDMATLAEQFASGNVLRREEILKYALESVVNDYDYILIDCAPSLDITTKNALSAATDAYVPVSAEFLPTKGLKSIIEILTNIRRNRINPNINITGVITTKFIKGRAICNDVHESLIQQFGKIVFKTTIRENVSITESPAYNKDIFEHKRSSLGAKDYMKLVDEILTRETSLLPTN